MRLYLWSGWAIVYRHLIELKRYAFNTLSTLATVYLVFLLMFFGARILVGGEAMFGDTLEGLIVGFMVWTLSIVAYSELSWALMREAQLGTLEQLYMSPAGFRWVTVCWAMGAFLTSLVFSVPIVLLMMATTGRYLSLDVPSLLPLLLLTVSGVFGIGLAVAGLALVFKRIQAAFQILQFVFVAFLFAPSEPAWAKALPLNWGTELIGRVMVHGMRLTEMPGLDLLILLANAVGWFGAGFLVFSVLERTARRRGLLGHY
ncbi:MAG: ABC transporter permease [Candidatus Bipolaricaulota bacterium]